MAGSSTRNNREFGDLLKEFASTNDTLLEEFREERRLVQRYYRRVRERMRLFGETVQVAMNNVEFK
ncbi:uncharacterized protein CELE_F13A2.10 [Caenorhabditis elegans]|uniref:Uncharacterized protein n=1 Tax=Caenorhabditis elegans TaxID=6239 RepID=D6VP97_CAEEL|nr:Uncharacterized protein CELE_F13A2.10 [Caenorhabditis elegans]CCD69370.1 Uncharacterized protein CELE_F13A2.10 [Caenorhabditis elegans]|eukprot:NP_001256038.1 Uncharacterized protein CELE_F13A2.10 [Caenorhabditis elegans]